MTGICIVHHNRKPSNGGSRAGMEMLGSVALHAWVDCALYAQTKDAESIITVQRETKLAPGMTFRIKIPYMFKHHDPYAVMSRNRQLWDPEFQEEGVDQPASKPTPDTKSKAGQRLAWKLKMCGGGPMSVERFEDIMGSKVGDQLEAAISNGFIQRDEDGRIRLAS